MTRDKKYCHFCNEELTPDTIELSDQNFEVCEDCQFEIDDDFDENGKPI